MQITMMSNQSLLVLQLHQRAIIVAALVMDYNIISVLLVLLRLIEHFHQLQIRVLVMQTILIMALYIVLLQHPISVILPVKHVQQLVVVAAPNANQHKTELYQELLVHAQLDIMKYQIQVLVY